ncbi:MAG: dihydrolipoamide acetyltransferase family protein [Myxococcota bacterium]|nr:dihydrolipoamide acetyltransferase family protein [Myxococcota bacterium]
MVRVELPELGESVLEGTVSQWLVREGDRVDVDQPLVEVTTDKVDAEIPSPVAGVVTQILVAEGETVPVGEALVVVDSSADASANGADASADRVEDPAQPETASGEGPLPAGEVPPPTPVARRVAAETSVDLDRVQGTGSAGRVTKADVLRHAKGPEDSDESNPPEEVPMSRAVASSPPEPRGRRPQPAYAQYTLQPGDEVVPLSPQRRLIAEHMVYSKHTSPHVGTVAEVDFSAVARLRGANKDAFQQAHGIALTYLPFVVHAVVRALREFPRLNASLLDDHIVEKKAIHIGVAVETEKGLVAPVVRDADRLSLAGTAMAMEDLSSRARSRKLSADELRGGTFTVSNPGRRGNLYGFAIINQPQVGILRMGEIVKRPVVRTIEGDDALVIRPMMMLALSYDHRVVDGAPANGFLYRIRELLEASEFDL